MRRNEAKYQAKLAGSITFFDGVPCKSGHIGPRYTRNSGCVQCALEEIKRRGEYTAAYREKHRERYAAQKRAWEIANPDRMREYRERRREAKRAYDKIYCAEKAERKRLATRLWAQANIERARLNARVTQAKRRGRERSATPSWADLDAIRRIYENCPPGMEVDHIIPLGGKTVCGLHVENNLQYLDPLTNRKKAASFGEHLGNDSHSCHLAV